MIIASARMASLYDETGDEVRAHPLFYLLNDGNGVQFELWTPAGERIVCDDEGKGLYRYAVSGRRLFRSPPEQDGESISGRG